MNPVWIGEGIGHPQMKELIDIRFGRELQRESEREKPVIKLQNLASFKRYLIEDLGLLVVKGNGRPILSGMHVYNSRNNISSPREELHPRIERLLTAVSLAAISLAQRESWGWSIVFKGSPDGYFVGVEPEGMVCIRLRESDEERGQVHVQRSKVNAPITQSYIEPQDDDPVNAVEQYFIEALQLVTRIAVRSDGEGILVQSLPGGDMSSVTNLNVEELFSFIDEKIESFQKKDIGEVLQFYECRCSEKMISEMIDSMQMSGRDEIFGDMPRVEIECPRCGKEYTVKKKQKESD